MQPHASAPRSRRAGTLLAALTTFAVCAGTAEARSTQITQPLAATSAAPGAHGQARLVLRGTSDGTFLVVGHRLARHASFEVIVDSVRVGALATNAHGTGKARFRSRPRHRDQLLGFEPRGSEVHVRNQAGEDVLDGTIPGTTPPPGAVICCVPDHGGDGTSECEDRTADECAQAGGTVSTATSCLPNPCATTPPVGDDTAVCCSTGSAHGAFVLRHDDPPGEDHGVECELRSAAKCAERGGTTVAATSCTPDPCTPTTPPPPASEVVCCLPGYYTAGACAVLTSDQCAAQDGTVSTATSCTPSPCTASSGGHGGHGSDG